MDWRDLIWCRDLSLKLCRCCRTDSLGRRTAYCSDECRRWFNQNHFWWAARPVALRRAHEPGGYRCADCEGLTDEPEVDHIRPVGGSQQLRNASCYNHQANLQVLCIRCHKFKTASQRARPRVNEDGRPAGRNEMQASESGEERPAQGPEVTA